MALSSAPAPSRVDEVEPLGLSALTIVFDEHCGVCRDTVHQLRRWDHGRRLELVTFGAATASSRPELRRVAGERPYDDAIHVIDETTGAVVAGGPAALAILDALPGGWLLRPWAALPPAGAAADLLYRVASRHRDRLAWLLGFRDELACPIEPGRGSGTAVLERPLGEPRSDRMA